jgi:hypothetical protein
VRLRYIGVEPTTFVDVGELEPGDVITVPDDQAEPFLRRADFEEAPEDPAPAKTRKAPKATASTDKQSDAASAAPEEAESGAVSDDH